MKYRKMSRSTVLIPPRKFPRSTHAPSSPNVPAGAGAALG
jgi:hypothetical protein